MERATAPGSYGLITGSPSIDPSTCPVIVDVEFWQAHNRSIASDQKGGARVDC